MGPRAGRPHLSQQRVSTITTLRGNQRQNILFVDGIIND